MCATKVDGAVAAGMMAGAIEYCAQKAGFLGKEEALAALRSADCTACEYLRHGLAREVASFLGSVDSTVKAIYSYDPEHATGAEDALSSPGINLVAHVSRKSAALTSVVGLVTAALAEERGRLACPKANALCHALDIQIVDDRQVEGRSGYGALVNSLHVRPLQIWRR